MAGPKAPDLPANLPPDLRAFLECKTRSVTIADGPLTWVDGQPSISIEPGTAPGTASIGVSVLGLKVQLPAAIVDGALSIDTSAVKDILPEGATNVIEELNEWFRSNGHGWGPPAFGKGTTTLTKVPVTYTKAGPHGTILGSEPPPYVQTKVPVPPLPKAEMFPPATFNAASYAEFDPATKAQPEPPPEPKPDPKPSSGVVGAGGPGGPKAPAGLGKLGVYAVIVVMILTAIVGGIMFLGGGKTPVVTPGPGATPTPEPVAVGSEVPAEAVCAAAAALKTFLGNADPICALMMPDGRSDGVEYNGDKASIQPANADIVATGAGMWTPGGDFGSTLTDECPLRDQLLCAGLEPTIAKTYAVWGFELAGTLEQQAAAFYEIAVGFNDKTVGNGVGATTWDGPIADPLTGSNLVYTVRLPSIASGVANAGPYRLAYDKDGKSPFFLESPSSAFVFVNGKFIFHFIPITELAGVTSYRAFTFHQEDQNGPSAVDLAPNHDVDPAAIPSLADLISIQGP